MRPLCQKLQRHGFNGDGRPPARHFRASLQIVIRQVLHLSNGGSEKFLRWNRKVPPLELESSSLGTKKFQEGNYFWNSYMLRNQHDTNSINDYAALAMPRTYNRCRDARSVRPLSNGKTCHHNTVTGRTDRASLQRATRSVADMWRDLRSFVQEV